MTLWFLGVCWVPLSGQDGVFSQYLQNSLALNPAFAGTSGNMEMFTGYHQERFGGVSQFETMMASYQQPSSLLHGGFGLTLYRDAATQGFISENALSLIYAYHLRLSRTWNVSAGFQSTLVQRNLNTDGMILPDMIDPVRGAVLPSAQTIDPWSRFYFDAQFGFLIYDRHWFASFSSFHLLEPRVAPENTPETSLQRRFLLLGGRSMDFKTSVPSFSEGKCIAWGGINDQGGIFLPVTGIHCYTNVLNAGLAWQGGLSEIPGFIIPSVGIATKNIEFTYSYNVFVTGRVTGETKHVHEITLRYRLNRENLLVLPFTINLSGL